MQAIVEVIEEGRDPGSVIDGSSGFEAHQGRRRRFGLLGMREQVN